MGRFGKIGPAGYKMKGREENGGRRRDKIFDGGRIEQKSEEGEYA